MTPPDSFSSVKSSNTGPSAVRRTHQTKPSNAAFFPDVPGEHEMGMVVGFECDDHGRTWCARRTLSHAQFILLIFKTLTHRPAFVRRLGPNRCSATPAVAESACSKAATSSTRRHLR